MRAHQFKAFFICYSFYFFWVANSHWAQERDDHHTKMVPDGFPSQWDLFPFRAQIHIQLITSVTYRNLIWDPWGCIKGPLIVTYNLYALLWKSLAWRFQSKKFKKTSCNTRSFCLERLFNLFASKYPLKLQEVLLLIISASFCWRPDPWQLTVDTPSRI